MTHVEKLNLTDNQQCKTDPNLSRLIPVPQWNQHHQWPTQSGLRYWIFHAKTNGFEKVIRRVGRRLLIDEAAFFEWVNAQQGIKNEK
jgi:hypothetical protein